MRILHTADWHLGKRLGNQSRLEEQEQVLMEIADIAESQSVDMVIVAGDLFDNFNPSNDATDLLYKALKRLANNGKIPVVAIAGNHDSPERINVADVLARENGIVFIGSPNDTVKPFSLKDGFKITQSDVGFVEFELPGYSYPLRLIHTAFANEQRLKTYFGEDKQASLQEALQQRWQNIADSYCDNKGVNLLTTHLYMAKRGGEQPEEPDGERPLNIGNADRVYSDAIPHQIQYAALGHLHSYQNVGSKQPVIYSSAILQYSFAEAGQQKYVSIIDVEPDKLAKVSRVALQSGKELTIKSFSNIDDAVEWLENNTNTWLELTFESDEFLKVDEQKKLFDTHAGIIHLIPRITKQNQQVQDNTTIDLTADIESLFVDYFKSKNNGQVPNEDILALFKEIHAS
jgi:exonuclease SbcD